jgi:hypothetical protein
MVRLLKSQLLKFIPFVHDANTSKCRQVTPLNPIPLGKFTVKVPVIISLALKSKSKLIINVVPFMMLRVVAVDPPTLNSVEDVKLSNPDVLLTHSPNS